MNALALEFMTNSLATVKSSSFSNASQDGFRNALDSASKVSSSNSKNNTNNSNNNNTSSTNNTNKTNDQTKANNKTNNADSAKTTHSKDKVQSTDGKQGTTEISDEDAIAMMATMLQIPMEQLVQALIGNNELIKQL